MASAKGSRRAPAGGVPVGRLLAVFAVIVAGVYAMIFFAGPKTASPKLGIDLQGGTRVTLTPRTPDGKTPSKDSLDRAQQIIGSRVNGLGVSGSEVRIDGNNLVITVPGTDSTAAKSVGQTAKLYIRPVEGSLPWTAPKVPAPAVAAPGTPEAAKQLQDAQALRQSSDPKIQQQAVASLDCRKPDALEGYDDPKKPLIACGDNGKMVYALGPEIIDGQEVADAAASYDSQQGLGWVINMKFKATGSDQWAKYTGANVGKQTAIVLDSKVISAETINQRIVGDTQISGKFTSAEAKDLANSLKYGSLPLKFDQSEAQTVSATLGLASLRAGLLAGVIGLIAVMLYCLFYYRALGLMVIWSLICSGVVVFGLLVLLGRWMNYTLDLAGIAGLIIGIGMTADSFVVFFERIKDEMREGRTFRSAVPRGWARAQRTNLSGKTVSLIASAVLYLLASGQVKGFAFTLGLTTIMDVVVLYLVTSPLMALASRSPFWSKPSVNGLGAVTQVAQERRAAARVLVKEA